MDIVYFNYDEKYHKLTPYQVAEFTNKEIGLMHFRIKNYLNDIFVDIFDDGQFVLPNKSTRKYVVEILNYVRYLGPAKQIPGEWEIYDVSKVRDIKVIELSMSELIKSQFMVLLVNNWDLVIMDIPDSCKYRNIKCDFIVRYIELKYGFYGKPDKKIVNVALSRKPYSHYTIQWFSKVISESDDLELIKYIFEKINDDENNIDLKLECIKRINELEGGKEYESIRI